MLKIKYYYFEKGSLVSNDAYINPNLISSITKGYKKYKKLYYVNIDGNTYSVKEKSLNKISDYLGYKFKL